MSDQGPLVPISDEQAKAIQVAFKAAQEAIKTLQGVGGFLREAFGTAPEDIVAVLGGNWLKVRRAENLIVTLHKMQERLKKRGINPEQVSLSRALPILIAAADESIDELQELWARLLAAAADPKRTKSFRIAFIDIAKKMDPLDALVLEQAGATNQVIIGTIRNDLADRLNLSRDQIDVSLSHLIELNLMWGRTVEQTPDATISPLGREFLKAVAD